jgi:hypothetical protein
MRIRYPEAAYAIIPYTLLQIVGDGMSQPSIVPTFPEWVRHIFDHRVGKPEWYWALEADTAEPPAQTSVVYLTRLFTDPEPILAPYTDAQLNQGLWYLVSNSCSNYMFTLLEPEVAWPERRAGLRAITNLFARLLANRCSPHLSHLDERGANPLNSACYMWWDLFPTRGHPENPTHALVDGELLVVMQRVLALDALACQESALHGLGHWHLRYPAEVEGAIDVFLESEPPLDPRLRQYAFSARRGCVL